MLTQGSARIPVREAVLHCAAIKTGQFSGMTPLEVFTTINRWHIERGYKAFGYHGLFMPDGGFYSGRPFDQIGAHVAGENAGKLGFLLIESRQITRMGQFSDWFTDAQRDAVKRMLAAIPGLERVAGHNAYANKLCPGFYVRSADWL